MFFEYILKRICVSEYSKHFFLGCKNDIKFNTMKTYIHTYLYFLVRRRIKLFRSSFKKQLGYINIYMDMCLLVCGGSKYLYTASKSNKISCLLTIINVMSKKYTIVRIFYFRSYPKNNLMKNFRVRVEDLRCLQGGT